MPPSYHRETIGRAENEKGQQGSKTERTRVSRAESIAANEWLAPPVFQDRFAEDRFAKTGLPRKRHWPAASAVEKANGTGPTPNLTVGEGVMILNEEGREEPVC